MTQRRVIVAGGGIAGIAAALRLAERGVAVTLLETRRKLGGRATSFNDVRTGETLDNCQHVAMGACACYLDLLRRLKVDHLIDWTEHTLWVEAGGRRSTLRPAPLPAPGHLAPSLLTARFLTTAEKLQISRATLAALRADRAKWRSATFADWLTAHAQSPGAISKFWSPIIVSACNLTVDRVAASSALHVIQGGFLRSRAAGRIGLPRVPLVDLYDPAEEAIRAAGGSIRLGESVERIDERAVVTTKGESIDADSVICALPFERAITAVDPAITSRDVRFDAMRSLTHSPILGVHLVASSQILDGPHAVLVNRPTHWLFNKGAAPDGAQRLHAVISAADEWVALSEDQIAQRVIDDLHACFPASRAVEFLSVRPVKEKRATFAATPDSESLRPPNTGDSAIILAGDYTATGWPATMEGAVRSGYAAAAAALDIPAHDLFAPEIPPGLIPALLGTAA